MYIRAVVSNVAAQAWSSFEALGRLAGVANVFWAFATLEVPWEAEETSSHELQC